MTSAAYSPGHLAALRRFAVAITVLTVLGHAVLGFEPSYAQPLVAMATAYAMQLLLELVEARCNGRRPRFAGGPIHLVDFLLSAHISGAGGGHAAVFQRPALGGRLRDRRRDRLQDALPRPGRSR